MKEKLKAAKAGNLGQLLLRAARLYNETAVAKVQSSESSFSIAHTTLMPHIALTGTRSSELAQKMGVSKQAVSQLVNELEKQGFLERVPDPTDGRAKLVVFTSLGKDSLIRGLAVLKQVEMEITSVMGNKDVEDLKSHLQSLLDHFEA